MKFSSALIAAVAVSSVNAAALFARDIRASVQQCLDDIAAAQNQLQVVTTGVTNWTVSSGYLGALQVQSEEQELESLLNTAGTDCCQPITDVTDEEAQAIIDQLNTLLPLVNSTLNIIVTRKPDFDSVPLVTSLVKTDIQNLRGETETVADCLLNDTPTDYQDQAQAIYNAIESAFNAAYDAYGL